MRGAEDYADTDSCVALAGCLRVGDGITPNLEAAFRWAKCAAEQGHVAGIRMLGKMLMTERSPPQVPEAAKWFARGADLGDEHCLLSLRALRTDGSAEAVHLLRLLGKD